MISKENSYRNSASKGKCEIIDFTLRNIDRSALLVDVLNDFAKD